MITLHNTNRHIAREVFSADGDSVQIMPNAKQPVDDKFAQWNLPRDVIIAKASHTTFGKKTITKVEDDSAANITENRDTVRTSENETTDSTKPKSVRNTPNNPNPAAQNKKDKE